MNRWSLILVLTSTLLLVECGDKQASSKPGNQNQNDAAQAFESPLVAPVPPPRNQSDPSPSRPFYPRKNGYVPDEQTAISIAVAVWIPIYGKEKIESEKPFKATLKDGVWMVTGTLPGGDYVVGGTAVAEISQADGCILRVMHYK